MPSQEYDYLPLGASTHKSYRRRFFWPAVCVALVLADAAAFVLYILYGRGYYTPLDSYQKLNNVSVVDTAAPSPLFLPAPIGDDFSSHAVVSSLYTESYITAVTVLGHSLRAANTRARLILIYIPGRISNHTLCRATSAGWTPHPVPYIPPPNHGKGVSPNFLDQYTKLNIWTLDALGVRTAVYLDADTLVRRNFDELFALPFSFAAVPDVFGDPRGFAISINAGVLFLRPNSTVFADMLAQLETARYQRTFAEQAFLNLYFGAQAARLPYAYNANLAIKQRSTVLWDALADDVRIIHYTVDKPFPLHDLGTWEMEDFFRQRRGMKRGMWRREMVWWQDAWRAMQSDLLHSGARCE